MITAFIASIERLCFNSVERQFEFLKKSDRPQLWKSSYSGKGLARHDFVKSIVALGLHSFVNSTQVGYPRRTYNVA